LIGPGARDWPLLAWRICASVAPTAFRVIGFVSAGRSGDDAGDMGETTLSGSGLLTSLAPYSGVGRRAAESGETVADVGGLNVAAV
jgi:hypothetical protein